MIGTLLGNRYEIIERIGSGGMAHVYLAKCRLLNRDVAIKVLRDELKENIEFVDRFKVEAQAAASLSHPNIVSVYDVGEENGIYYFVMEYIEGITLKDYVTTKGALDYKEAIGVILQVASAIEHAHKKSIIHRDIKPHNILINKEGIAKVTDFGIARAVTDATMVKGGNVIGSVHYFSPEQARGMDVDYKSDIYSLGIVLYEMLTGSVPFDADTPFAVAKMQVEATPLAPSLKKEGIPNAIDGIVLKAMAKDPALRYQSASALIESLKQVMENPATRIDNEDVYATKYVPVVPTKEDDKAVKHRPEANARKDKRAVIFAWMTAAFFILAVGLYALYGSNLAAGKPKEKEVPQVVGMKYDEAKSKFTSDTVVITMDRSEFSEKYADGYILQQTPEKGEKYTDMPLEIRVVVSKGMKKTFLEDYAGRNYKEVETELKSEEGLAVSIKYETDETYPIDVIIKTSPAAGSEMQEGERVTLYVSTGPEVKSIKVPNVVGMKEEQAVSAIKSAQLTVNVSSQESNKEKGTVISQSPQSDAQVSEKTAITIVVSSGGIAKPDGNTTGASNPTASPGKKVKMPGLVGMNLEEAKSAVSNAGLSLSNTITYVESADYPKGVVIFQSPAAGESIAEKSKVEIKVSSGR